jgi:fumarate reductase flavoprotein subunit
MKAERISLSLMSVGLILILFLLLFMTACSETTVSAETLKLETQIVVIGGGGAGLSAAVAAAEKGADVILLEKQSRLGGTSAMAGGPFAVESPLQKRMGINLTRDEYFKIAMEYSHHTINPRIVRAYIDKSGDTVRWLEEKGIEFELRPHPPDVIPKVYHVAKGRGAKIVKVLKEQAESLGVRIYLSTPAKEILIDDLGGVSGVLAENKAGEEIRINAGKVIIATGGFGGNREMLKQYYPYYHDNMHLHGFPNMGDGILMAIKSGAATQDLGNMELSGPFISGEPRSLAVTNLQPTFVFFNKRGERFADEAYTNGFEFSNQLVRQPDGVVYAILDDKMKQQFKSNYPERPGQGPFVLGDWLGKTEKRGHVKISDSWGSIAQWMGITPQTLRAAVDEYNSFCDKGYDPVFNKDPKHLIPLKTPPFYAIRIVTAYIGTIGGIKINHHMEVLNSRDDPIPGLYAAGVDVGGWEPETYNSFLPGSSFGFSLNSGRIAGENAANME